MGEGPGRRKESSGENVMAYEATKIQPDDLRPCPFCGQKLVLLDDHHGSWYAHKDNGGYCEASYTQLFDAEDVKRWNTRV